MSKIKCESSGSEVNLNDSYCSDCGSKFEINDGKKYRLNKIPDNVVENSVINPNIIKSLLKLGLNGTLEVDKKKGYTFHFGGSLPFDIGIGSENFYFDLKQFFVKGEEGFSEVLKVISVLDKTLNKW